MVTLTSADHRTKTSLTTDTGSGDVDLTTNRSHRIVVTADFAPGDDAAGLQW